MPKSALTWYKSLEESDLHKNTFLSALKIFTSIIETFCLGYANIIRNWLFQTTFALIVSIILCRIRYTTWGYTRIFHQIKTDLSTEIVRNFPLLEDRNFTVCIHNNRYKPLLLFPVL